MREAAVPGYRLRNARPSTKVLISLAVFGLFLGLIGAAALSFTKTGLTYSSVIDYYRGAQQDGAPDSLSSMLLPSSPRPFAELAEVSHTHLTGGSLLLFLLCHLLALCELKELTRMILYTGSFAGFLLSFSLPWFIRYVHPWFAAAYAPSLLAFSATLGILCFLPLREMWLGRPGRLRNCQSPDIIAGV